MALVPIRGLSSLSDLEEALRLARTAVGYTPGVGIVFSGEALAKLRWLKRSGRDFRVVNDTLLREMNAAFTHGLMRVLRRRAPVSEPWRLAGEAYKSRLSARLANGGADIASTLRPLKPATVARKGFDKIGYDSGDLLRDVAASTVRTTGGK